MKYRIVVANNKNTPENIIYFDDKDEAMNYAEYLANNIFMNFNEHGIKYFQSVDSNSGHIYNKTIHAYEANGTKFIITVDEEED